MARKGEPGPPAGPVDEGSSAHAWAGPAEGGGRRGSGHVAVRRGARDDALVLGSHPRPTTNPQTSPLQGARVGRAPEPLASPLSRRVSRPTHDGSGHEQKGVARGRPRVAAPARRDAVPKSHAERVAPRRAPRTARARRMRHQTTQRTCREVAGGGRGQAGRGGRRRGGGARKPGSRAEPEPDSPERCAQRTRARRTNGGSEPTHGRGEGGAAPSCSAVGSTRTRGSARRGRPWCGGRSDGPRAQVARGKRGGGTETQRREGCGSERGGARSEKE